MEFLVFSYLGTEDMGEPERYSSYGSLVADLQVSAMPDYRSEVMRWAESAKPGDTHEMMNGKIREVWLVQG